jgi:Cu(I)/Ag(I) efflux system periplasmic protein CusF
MRKTIIIASWLVFGSLLLGGGGWAASGLQAPASSGTVLADVASLPPAQDLPLAKGRVLAVDPDSGRVTIDHGPIARLALQPMVDVFYIADPDMLTGLSAGDKIRFEARRDKHRFIITRVENTN